MQSTAYKLENNISIITLVTFYRMLHLFSIK